MKLWKISIWGIVFMFFLLIYSFMIGFSSNQPGSFFNKGHNAVWLGHKWVGEFQSDSEIRRLVNNFNKYQINTVFVHSGPLESDGRVDPKTYGHAISFLERAKAINPEIQYQAWLGQIRKRIDLDKLEVRHEVAKVAMTMTGLVGFDGVHFDIEPVWDEDLDFILMLEESRKMMPEDKKISVALADFIPGLVIKASKPFHQFENYNSEVNYENVAKYADQIVVMLYDTGIKEEWLYQWLVKEQVIWLSRLLEERELFIGLPAYDRDEHNTAIYSDVENLENGLLGMIQGLNNLRSKEENFAGVAIYPYWQIDEDKWAIYEELWLK